MQRILFLAILFAALNANFSFAAVYCNASNSAAIYAGGNGSAAHPYGICSLAQLANIDQNPQASYELWSDLHAAPEALWIPLTHPFTGTLDGLNHSIVGLTIHGGHAYNTAIFQNGYGCSIRNLKIESIKVTGGPQSAALIGNYMVQTSGALPQVTNPPMNNIFVSGTITGESESGGIFGIVYNVAPELSDDAFLRNGVEFKGTVTNSDFHTQTTGMTGSYEYD